MTTLPEYLILQWHPTQNVPLCHSDVSASSSKKVWWLGDCEHEWDESPRNRILGHGCPFCSNHRILEGFNDFQTLYPSLAKEWHPTKNGELLPTSLSKSSRETVWWLCEKGHEWDCVLKGRVSFRKGVEVVRACPYCSNRKVLKGFNDLESQFSTIAAEWHPTKNGDVLPSEIVATSATSYFWVGAECGHVFKQPVGARTKHGTGCPFCAGISVLAGFNDLESQSPKISSEWHPTKNGDITPLQVMNGSNKKVWWLGDCGHEWEGSISKRTKHSQGCPYCAGRRGALVGINDIATKRPDLLTEWHPTKNGSLALEKLSFSSHVEVWWQCEAGHEWKTPVYSRVLQGNGCGLCSGGLPFSKGEHEVASFITGLGFTVLQGSRSVLNGKELDIYIPELNMAVEYNGLYWHSEPAGKDRNYHYDKWLECKDKGIQLIQIWEDEWQRHPELVKRMLSAKMGVSSLPKIYARKTVAREVSKTEAEVLLEMNHIQGFASGSSYLGLEDRESNALVAVLVLKKESKGNNKVFNIVRYATSAQVIGGFTKLLSYAEKIIKPEIFVTFSDHCVSDGSLYRNNGFVADKELPPDYMYVEGKTRKHKFGYRLKRFRSDPDLVFREGLSERELAEINGLKRIWDAGKTRWKKECKQN